MAIHASQLSPELRAKLGLVKSSGRKKAKVAEVIPPAPTGKQVVIVGLAPMGKPRQTQRDKWAKRPEVQAYRAFADELRAAFKVAQKMPHAPVRVDWVGYFPMPADSALQPGALHRQTPDVDNCSKAIFDSLFRNDSAIACGYAEKRWDDGKGPRIELVIYWDENSLPQPMQCK